MGNLFSGLSSFLASKLSAIRGKGRPLSTLSDWIGVSFYIYLLGSLALLLPVDFTRVEKTWWISRKLVGNFSSGLLIVWGVCRVDSGSGTFRITLWLDS